MKIKRKRMSAEVPSLAMGDIAFNLLIFFVILARAHDDSFLQWRPAAADDLQQTEHSRASVLIDTDGKLYLNGQPVAIAALADELALLLGDAPLGERTVLLKCDRQAQAGRFEPVIEAISEAGGKLVHILEPQRE
jgi:biopolymer transport protein ExbD